MQKQQDDHIIAAVHITNRVKQASLVQKKLTGYGANIKTRIGLHEASGRAASPNGMIILELVGAQSRCNHIVAYLNAINGVEAKCVVFEH